MKGVIENVYTGKFGFIQPDIFSNLFKSYCCSFYGSFFMEIQFQWI